jgi:hypothetical protein
MPTITNLNKNGIIIFSFVGRETAFVTKRFKLANLRTAFINNNLLQYNFSQNSRNSSKIKQFLPPQTSLVLIY